MAVAQALAKNGRSVVLLESGDASPAASGSSVLDLSHAELTNPDTHAEMAIAVCRAFGGTSKRRGGRCVPFDPVDFSRRPYVDQGQWPIEFPEVQRWFPPAAEFLGCGGAEFQAPSPRLRTLEGVEACGLERWTRNPDIAAVRGDAIRNSRNIDLRLSHTLVKLQLVPDGRVVQSALVAHPEGQYAVRAKRYVLAAGGLETTRLLLATQRDWPGHFGGRDGPLGRYYMGHISGKVADIVLADPGDIRLLDFFEDQGAFVRRRFTLAEADQRANELLNLAFWLDNPPFYDASHRNGVLSLAFLLLAVPSLGRCLTSEAVRRAHVGPGPYEYSRHVMNVLRAPYRPVAELMRFARARYLSDARKPGFLTPNEGGRYALHYHGETAPNPNSRVMLSERADRLGMPRLAVDLRFSKQDAQSVLRSHEVLDDALRASGLGHLDYRYEAPERLEQVLRASDGYHQIGTARMGEDPDASVVNADSRIHSVNNLYVASSAVFPTSGQANPTFLAVALGFRLADHLHRQGDWG
jgi:choline dehydrogenase-like flavoprotein